MARFAEGVRAVTSVSSLLVGSGSLVPSGARTLAVFVTMPVAAGLTVPVARIVASAPAGRSTVVAMGADPLAAPQLPPAVAAHVHVTGPSCAGNVSVTAAPTTGLGPALCTVIV